MSSCDPTGLVAAMADPKLKQETLVDINKGILNSYYSFKFGAPLQSYIVKKRKSVRESYTLAEVTLLILGTLVDIPVPYLATFTYVLQMVVGRFM